MFQFPGLAPLLVLHLQCSGLSHSEIFGLSLVCSYPKLIAAYHVLLRLLVPRHPPYALIRFKCCVYFIVVLTDNLFLTTPCFYSKTCAYAHRFKFLCTTTINLAIESFVIDNKKNCFPNMSKNFSNVWILILTHTELLMSWLRTNRPYANILNHYSRFTTLTNSSIKKSGGYRSRTDDPLRARQVL